MHTPTQTPRSHLLGQMTYPKGAPLPKPAYVTTAVYCLFASVARVYRLATSHRSLCSVEAPLPGATKRMQAKLDFNPTDSPYGSVPASQQLPMRRGDLLNVNMSDAKRGDGLVKAQVRVPMAGANRRPSSSSTELSMRPYPPYPRPTDCRATKATSATFPWPFWRTLAMMLFPSATRSFSLVAQSKSTRVPL
jgi:hypothetical protein